MVLVISQKISESSKLKSTQLHLHLVDWAHWWEDFTGTLFSCNITVLWTYKVSVSVLLTYLFMAYGCIANFYHDKSSVLWWERGINNGCITVTSNMVIEKMLLFVQFYSFILGLQNGPDPSYKEKVHSQLMCFLLFMLSGVVNRTKIIH